MNVLHYTIGLPPYRNGGAAKYIYSLALEQRFHSGLTINRKVYIDALSHYGIKLDKNVSIGKYTTIECTGVCKVLVKD